MLLQLRTNTTSLHQDLPALMHAVIHLVDARYNPVLHDFCVSLPVLAILSQAFLLVSHFTVDEQDAKVDNIKVRENHPVTPGRTLQDFSMQVWSAIHEGLVCQ